MSELGAEYSCASVSAPPSWAGTSLTASSAPALVADLVREDAINTVTSDFEKRSDDSELSISYSKMLFKTVAAALLASASAAPGAPLFGWSTEQT